jgi:hypothetical protein
LTIPSATLSTDQTASALTKPSTTFTDSGLTGRLIYKLVLIAVAVFL